MDPGTYNFTCFTNEWVLRMITIGGNPGSFSNVWDAKNNLRTLIKNSTSDSYYSITPWGYYTGTDLEQNAQPLSETGCMWKSIRTLPNLPKMFQKSNIDDDFPESMPPTPPPPPSSSSASSSLSAAAAVEYVTDMVYIPLPTGNTVML